MPAHWRRWGFTADDQVLCACTYVDNLFSASHCLGGAINILEDFEEQLSSNWDLRIKPASRSCMAVAGSASQPLAEKKPLCNTFVVLGHTLQNNGSVRACWKSARLAMWRSYWANPGSKDARPLDVTMRTALLDKAVTPQLDYRCSRWPPQKTIASESGGLQRKMVASAMRSPRYPGEDVAHFVRRRGRAAALQRRQSGQWSQRWFKRATDWNEHLERPRNGDSWSSKLLHYRAREWLIQRRVALLPASGSSSSCLVDQVQVVCMLDGTTALSLAGADA